jgi:hypothetical protein
MTDLDSDKTLIMDEDFLVGGDGDRDNLSEFIVGADDVEMPPAMAIVGGSGGRLMICGLALLIVVLILVVLKLVKRRRHHHHRPQSVILAQNIPCQDRHGETFNRLLISPHYFDYSQHGTEYVNWS